MSKLLSGRFLGGLLAVAFVGGLLVEEADARSRRYRGRRVPRHQCIFTPEYNSQGFLIPPAPASGDKFVRFSLWSKDKLVHDHKLSFTEAGVGQKDFQAIDTNHDGYLDLKEMTATFNERQKSQAAGKDTRAPKYKTGI